MFIVEVMYTLSPNVGKKGPKPGLEKLQRRLLGEDGHNWGLTFKGLENQVTLKLFDQKLKIHELFNNIYLRLD